MRWLLIIVTSMLLFTLAVAQPPRREDEDPKAKPGKPIDIESFPPPKADAPKGQEGPGVKPGPGVLVVGVRAVPELISPSRARTDAERWALDLVFESLVRPRHAEAGMSFDAGLASHVAVEAGGRNVTLDPQAKWSDGTPVLANDVLTTLEKLRVAGRAEAFGEATSDASRRVRMTLRVPNPDPISLFSFIILPAARNDDEVFARAPLGSGPFTYAGATTQGGRTYSVFPANPQYGQRASRLHRPHVREVRFLSGPSPIDDFRRGLADFVMEDRTPALLGNAPATPRLESGLPTDARVATLPSRRIDYLAVNPLKMALGGEAGRSLRRAIAFGLRRDVVLDDVWRAKAHPFHKALTGPFPTGAWPCDPEAKTLDDESLARAELRSAKLPAGRMILIHDISEPAIGMAAGKIAGQLQDLGIPIDAKPLSSVEFRRALAEKSFDLAYRQYEYHDDWFDPAELFSVHHGGTAGSSRLEATLARGASRAEFATLRDARRRLHNEFRESMPFVPLWSLDVHIVTRNVEPYPAIERLDPQAPFTDIDRWKLSR